MINSSQSLNEIIKDFLRKISLEWVKNFSVQRDIHSVNVLIHFEPLKKIIKYFIIFIMIIWVPMILIAPVDIIIKVLSLFTLPAIFFFQNRIYIKITKYHDGKVEIIKQWSFRKMKFLLQLNSKVHIIAQLRNWVGNKYIGGSNFYELILIYIDEIGSEMRISSVFDDRKFWFTGGRNNIKWVLKEEEIREIANELELPYSVNNS